MFESFMANNQVDEVVSEKLQKKLRKVDFKTGQRQRLAVFQHCVHHNEPCLVAFPASSCSLCVIIVSINYSLHLGRNRAGMVLRQCHNSGMRARITTAHVVHARAASSQPQAANTTPQSKTGTTRLRSAQKGFDVDLVCPICLQTEFKIDASAGPTYRSFPCSKCKRTFTSSRGVPDLTLTSGIDPGVYKSESFAGQDIFRNPLVSFIYERGWRQGFKSAGFPGADEELELAMEFLTPAFGEVLLDLSCGSGLFTRRFVASNIFSGVIGADYSESMLQQTKQLFNQDQLLDSRKLALVRADVARLPFATGSLAAIHAGAAIHCWPDPTAAMVEISRVLRPGGVFVASTFLKTFSPLGELFGDDTVRPLNQLSSSRSLPYRWWEEQELRDLTAAMGLQNFQRHRQNRFIMFAVSKPQEAREQQ